MRKQYDDFTQMKIKDLCKSISDMTYSYINPETNEPTKVPAMHYEKILEKETENYISEQTSRKFLTIMYEQLASLKKEDEKYFHQALLCIDLGLNPKDLRVSEQIALGFTYSFLDQKQKAEKKDFHLLDEEIVDTYYEGKNNPLIQSEALKYSEKENSYKKRDFENEL